MNPWSYQADGAFKRVLQQADRTLWVMGGLFWGLSALCLVCMTLLTTASIVLRAFGTSAYWLFPWTVVFFVWLSFFGFFSLHARVQDIRVRAVADALGPFGQVATRILTDVASLLVVGIVLYAMPVAWNSASGYVDGAILPGGREFPRRSFFVPLILSSAGIILVSLLDLAKCAAGLPENASDTHPEI